MIELHLLDHNDVCEYSIVLLLKDQHLNLLITDEYAKQLRDSLITVTTPGYYPKEKLV